MSRLLSSALFALVCSAAGSSAAQVPLTSKPMSPNGVVLSPADIHVDEHCRVFTQDRDSPLDLYRRPQFRHDAAYCELGGQHNSSFVQVTNEGGVVSRTRIETHEQTYVLHNPEQRQVVFIVALPVQRGWILQADMDPSDITKFLQTYRISARAGQTVTLRVTSHD